MYEQTDSTMKDAFREAGKDLPEDRWKRLVKKAHKKHPKSIDLYVEYLGTLVCDDAELLWYLIQPYWRSIALVAIQKWGFVNVDAHSRKPPKPNHGNNNAAAAAANEAMGRTLLMEEMTELGKPVGDLTGLECTALARRNARRFRYFGWLGQQVPSHERVRSCLVESDLVELKRSAEGDDNGNA